jgi:Holliday junction resolvase
MKTSTTTKPTKRRVDSRAKGARGERELALFLQSRGFEARRGQQNKGGSDSPDVITNLPGTHIECKRTETLSLYTAMAQSIRDAGGTATPTVFHKRNNKEWLVILRADDFLNLLPWVAQ